MQVAAHLSRKDSEHRLLLHVRVQMAVAAALLLGLMAYDVVDDALVDAPARQGGDEGMTKNMPALQPFPRAEAKSPPEIMVGFTGRDRLAVALAE